jgi:hypothetical protein
LKTAFYGLDTEPEQYGTGTVNISYGSATLYQILGLQLRQSTKCHISLMENIFLKLIGERQ